MFSCLQILEAFLWFVLITLLNVTLIILTLSVSMLLNLLLRLVAFLLFLNPQCLASDRKSGSAGMPRPSSYYVFCFLYNSRLSILHSCTYYYLLWYITLYYYLCMFPMTAIVFFFISLHAALPIFGGFFIVRSYYPSECHADYFDFERIEALKPAIEACGISTLSQSPMIGF